MPATAPLASPTSGLAQRSVARDTAGRQAVSANDA